MINTVNDNTVTVKITRDELIDLLLLCSAHIDDGKKCELLHDKLYNQLYKHDNKEARN